jgi:tripartite-type tricarboxylate transporter receptor subunit TctC
MLSARANPSSRWSKTCRVNPIAAMRLRNETNRLLADPDLRERIRNLGGLEPYVMTPEEFAALIRAEHAKYAQVVKAAGAKVD